MNKRILSILLCLMLVVSLLVLAVPVNAAPSSVDLTITADKTEAEPGDTVNFTVTLGPVSEMGGFAFTLSIPDGMTFVTDSGTLTVTKAQLGFDDIGWTESSLYANGVASEDDYSSTSDTELMTFQCTVNDDATGTQTVSATVRNADWFSCQTWEKWGNKVNIVPVDVTIGGATEAPTEAPTDEPTEAPTDEPTEAPTDEPTEAHVHDNPLRYEDEVPATYDSTGTKAYYICDTCGQKFWDALGQNPVENDEDLIIPKLTPTEAPTEEPTEAPTDEPTEAPTEEPTEAPTDEPTEAPTDEPTEAPTDEPTEAPTEAPTTVEPTTVEPTTTDVTETATEATGDEATKDTATKDSTSDSSSTSTSSTPKTSDNTHMYLWLLIMLASLAGACAVVYTAKRKGIFTK